ncbi:OmpA family protein [Labrys sp. LIt4]|uniref:OmpA family protein n=1 Tax=Labrys sp. LIt4 TaxID=2821355 RepID=UPI001ADF1FAD|nr:OmpA family protein [Labrys sp. LIt4]MBP0582281.1 OmpA family protein [Labrys sp. LIt4]
MLLRKKLIRLAGTLMLAVSPTAIVLVQTALAQDAQAPTTEAPAPGAKPSVEDILKRHKKGAGQDGEGAPAKRAAPAESQDQDGGAPAAKPKRQKPSDEQGGAAPGSGADEAPAAKPRRQKPASDAAGQEAPGESAPGETTPAAKPKRQKPSPDATQEAPGKPTAEEPAREAPGAKPKRQKPAAPGETTGQDAPAAKPNAPAQPDADQGGDTSQPRGKRRDRMQGQPGTEGTPQDLDDGQPQDRPLDGRPGGRNQLPGQGGIPLPADGTQQGQESRPGLAPPPGNGSQQGQGRPLQGRVDQAAEQRAIGLLGDTTPPDRLNDQQLRQRLNVYRSALAAGNLSEATEQALIQRLNGARAALRNRVADQEYGGGQQQDQNGRGSPFGRSQFRQDSPRPQDIPAILADRRPSNVLTVDQLNRRILVYRDAANDQRYSPEDREAFAQYLRDDRNDLRRRLLSDRGQRTDRLRRYEGDERFDMDINPRGQRYQSVWAAEVDDDQIEQQFAARPLRPLPRRWARSEFLAQPEAIMEQPAIRQSIPSVELDTIRFGFNESFLREEEIANLDRIGRIIERIVAAHPDEVFVIEGNTDAVGDDAYNLRLSKERAEAVKQALTQYYVISPDNLVTAGLGERYLKIPTPEPEQENRRVTLRRITPLLEK